MAGSSLTVACVLWVGDFRGRKYGPEWVRKLKRMAAKRVSAHRFVCLSNTHIKGVKTVPLTEGWPGWWSKVELFKHDFGRTLYLDLDTILVDDLTPIAEYPALFAAMPPSYKFTGGQPAGGPGVVDRYQTSCMVWGKPPRIAYEQFSEDAMRRFRGDQDWLSHIYPGGETLPPEWFQKLRHCQSGPPKDAKVVLSMPWKNDEASRKFDWVNEIWQ